MLQNLYIHVESKEELLADVKAQKDEREQKDIANTYQKNSVQTDREINTKEFDKITYLEEIQKDINFSYL
jgi:hypothetical protein